MILMFFYYFSLFVAYRKSVFYCNTIILLFTCPVFIIDNTNIIDLHKVPPKNWMLTFYTFSLTLLSQNILPGLEIFLSDGKAISSFKIHLQS